MTGRSDARAASAARSRHGVPAWLGTWFAMALVILGSVVLQAGVVAGYVNRQVLDTDRFSAQVDELRREPAVSAALGRELTDSLLKERPDAVAIRPLIDTVAAAVVGSDALSGPTRAAVAQLQRSLTEPGADTFVLRVADAGAVLTAVLQRIAPQQELSSRSALPLELARIGDQSFAGRTIALARFVRTMSWALPLAGVGLMVLGVVLARRRRRAVFGGGLALLAGSGLLAIALLAGGWWAGTRDDATVAGALVHHGWPILLEPAWWSILAVGVIGLLLAASAASLLPEADPAVAARGALRIAARRPRRTLPQLVRALVLLLLGIGAVVRPLAAVALAGVVAGVWLFLYGVHELSTAANAEDPRRGRGVRRTGQDQAALSDARSWRTAVLAGGTAVAVLVAVVVSGAASSSVTAATPQPAAGAVTGEGEVCNGYSVLCGRSFNQVAFAASHNSMSTASDPGWFIPEQGPSLLGQLDDGVRALLIDVWPGYPTAGGAVATARSAFAQARAQLERDFGPEAVAAGLRIADVARDATPTGPEGLYMCHGLCELGASGFNQAMTAVKVWLDTHPDEVLTIAIEDHVPAQAIGAALEESGLSVYAAEPPPPGRPWPTLQEMITSGRRLYVVLEKGDGGTTYPWLANAYQGLIQETPYEAATLAQLGTCASDRGDPQAPLFLLNHWLSGFGELVTSARQANTTAVLGTRAERCRRERQLPNFVAVNYADIGDVHAVVRQLNGVG